MPRRGSKDMTAAAARQFFEVEILRHTAVRKADFDEPLPTEVA
jgi:hypothetical protein